MFVCICNQVTDAQLREEMERGAETVHQLRENLGVTNQCGKCGTCVKKCVREHVSTQADFFAATCTA